MIALILFNSQFLKWFWILFFPIQPTWLQAWIFFSVHFLCTIPAVPITFYFLYFLFTTLTVFWVWKTFFSFFWENTFFQTSFRLQSLLSSAVKNLADNGLTFDTDICSHFATRVILNAISAILKKVTQSKKLDWAVCMWLKDKYSSNHLGIKVFSCRLSWAERLNPILFLIAVR